MGPIVPPNITTGPSTALPVRTATVSREGGTRGRASSVGTSVEKHSVDGADCWLHGRGANTCHRQVGTRPILHDDTGVDSYPDDVQHVWPVNGQTEVQDSDQAYYSIEAEIRRYRKGTPAAPPPAEFIVLTQHPFEGTVAPDLTDFEGRNMTDPLADVARRAANDFYLIFMPLGASITEGINLFDGNGYRKWIRSRLRWKGWNVNMVGSKAEWQHGGQGQ
ncbi:hypothetical protein BJ170DRAFT_598746 [Xylariales sp. AK1849]|nr:hypothetical protein BJ170DRAFT_598746 [Xylariales sp. AK1849]